MQSAQHQLIPRQTTTHIIQALTRQDYISQVKNPKDGRSVLLVLTEKGRQYFEKTAESMLLLEQETVQQIGTDKFREYNRFYKEFLDRLYETGEKMEYRRLPCRVIAETGCSAYRTEEL